MKYWPIHEWFATWQGEGVHMGCSAFFVRTYGCPLKCPWCDSAGTWHPNFKPKDIPRRNAQEIVEAALTAGSAFIVVTGGEPTIHDLRELTDKAREYAIPIHLETSGSFPIQGQFDWITVSPKDAKAPLREVVEIADEFKIIVERPESISKWHTKLKELGLHNEPVWLHPEWSQRNNPAVLNAITEAAKGLKSQFRAGYQLHKLYKADTLDSRSAVAVPLGGNPTLGY